jgi:hypothetical protein
MKITNINMKSCVSGMCRPFLKPWIFSFHGKGIPDFNEAYKEAQILKRDVNRYLFNLFPFNCEDEKHVKNELKA